MNQDVQRWKRIALVVGEIAVWSAASAPQATLADPSLAQAPTGARTTPADQTPTDQLPTVTVESTAVDTTKAALPVRPQAATYGIAAKVVDTPRSITEVNTDQLAHDPIRTADDLVKYAPGISRGGGQNVSIAPQIRGQASELYQDGQRGYNVRHPTNFNSYEGADIVAGPSSVVFGPASASGGYTNYITKKPYFEGTLTEVSALLGTLSPGGQSRHFDRITADRSAPLSDDLAYRFSYTSQKSDDYFFNVKNDFDAYYGALAWKPRSNIRVDANVSYDDYNDFNVTHGWNRVTQQLIDSKGGSYQAGRATPIIQASDGSFFSPVFASGAPNSAVIGWQTRVANVQHQYVATGPVNNTSLPSASAATPGTIKGWVYDPTIPGNGLAAISTATSGRAEDKNTARRLITQIHAVWDVSSDFSVANSFQEEYSQDTGDSVGSFLSQYSDDIIEDRLELRGKHKFTLWKWNGEDNSNSGVIFRRETFFTEAANNSFNINPYDLTQNPSNKNPGSLLGLNPNANPAGGTGAWIGTAGTPQLSSYYGYLNLPPMYPVGHGLYAEKGGSPPGASYTAEGQWTTETVFTQHNFLVAERYGLNVGASRSYLSASIDNPLVLTPNDVHGDSQHYSLYSFQLSPFVKPTSNSTLYFTFDHTLALNTGGFANVLTWGSNNKLNPLSFGSRSQLYEGGLKADLIPDHLFGSIAGFQQARDTSPDTSGNIAREKFTGIEGTLRAQPDRHLSSGVNLTWLRAYYTYVVPSGFSPFGFVGDNKTVWGDSNALNKRPGGAYDAVGLPALQATGFVRYQLDSGLGAQLSGWWTNSWATNLSYSAVVPDEYQIDLSLFLRRPAWDIGLNIQNLTDQKNFANGLTGSTSEFLQPTPPLTAQLQGAVRF